MPPTRYANAPIIQISTAYHHIGGRAAQAMFYSADAQTISRHLKRSQGGSISNLDDLC